MLHHFFPILIQNSKYYMRATMTIPISVFMLSCLGLECSQSLSFCIHFLSFPLCRNKSESPSPLNYTQLSIAFSQNFPALSYPGVAATPSLASIQRDGNIQE